MQETQQAIKESLAIVQKEKIYVGGGISYNTISSSSAIGGQLLAGYQSDVKFAKSSIALETGFLYSGSYRACSSCDETTNNALLANVLIETKTGNQLTLIGRLGVDFSPRVGFVMGVGARYDFNPNYASRLDIVVLEEITSVQWNIIYHY